MLVQLTPKPGASKRTKERIKAHGPLFDIETMCFNYPICFDGQKAALCASKQTNWFGWLPTNEIKVTSD